MDQGAAPRRAAGPEGARGDATRGRRRAVQVRQPGCALHAIGEHHMSPESVASRVGTLVRDPRGRTRGGDGDARPAPPLGAAVVPAASHVEGFDDMLVRMARCCTPVPGDDIIGFVTRGRGVSVHRTDCANASSLAVGPRRSASSTSTGTPTRPGTSCTGRDQGARPTATAPGRHRTLSDHHVNILSEPEPLRARSGVEDALRVRLGDPSHLDTAAQPVARDRQRLRRVSGRPAGHPGLTGGPDPPVTRVVDLAGSIDELNRGARVPMEHHGHSRDRTPNRRTRSRRSDPGVVPGPGAPPQHPRRAPAAAR